MLDLICFGEPMVELMAQPGPPPSYTQGFGGDTSNTAIAAARQGAKVGYLCSVGSDLFGDALLKLWEHEKVDTQKVLRHLDASTGIYFVQPHEEQRHFSYYRKGSAASLFNSAQLPHEYLCSTKILHVSAISQAISTSMREAVTEALIYARSQGVITSYDTNLRLQLWCKDLARKTIFAALLNTDIVFPSIDEVTMLTGLTDKDKIVDFFLTKGPHTVVLKLGAQGAYIADAQQRHIIPPVTTTAVDSTGAGDAFAGAFLAAYSQGLNLADCGARAAYVAAVTISGYGAIDPIPHLDQPAMVK
jgi:2-dehydro-3-deoxygluconokinase